MTGDKIIKVDGQEVDWSMYEQAVAMMKTGEPEVAVEITILRDEEIHELTVRRDIVEIPDMEYEMLDEDIGYIWLYSFDGSAAKNFKNAVEELQDKDMRGLILDLRGNGGGLLEVCREIADLLCLKD